ncbi:MAG: class I SAM-dependent methyltransferase [Cytophagaceae bacterium]|jgi:SAM-dependent methyltransferase|nr:class I SAM-dependent methyltransferase [Cytophagaceae bacterium]
MVKTRTNDKNIEFYRNIALDTFYNLAAIGGFNTFRDIDQIEKYLLPTLDILEIGAGYGRCLDYFISHGHKGRLIALEKSEPLFRFLVEKYPTKVELISGDIQTLSLSKPVDVALWMWSGIVDFAPVEQATAIQNIYRLLKPGGRLFIDIPRLGVQTIAHHEDLQNMVFTTPFGEIQAYIPSDEDIDFYSRSAGFERFLHLDYHTATDKKRTIYILEK